MANDKVKSIDVVVAKRRSVEIDGVVKGPGSKLTLPLDEAESLYNKGFVVEPVGDETGQDAGGPTVQIENQSQ